ncbi:6885_t:CDS:2 [Ambispora leptoticha]|uniref:6885_t:CDS:1 n=1 Tax=Ambispora leptoticha TaxID=144679 RepID=A0A9N8WPP6_9GLOM|nr:6885_t:CDS:2 [Ambispora leptoticha]
MSSSSLLSSTIPTIEWSPLLPDSWLKEKPTSEILSREEMFVKERKRMALQGINSFQFEPNSGQILFSYGSGIYLGQVTKGMEFNPYPIIPYSCCPNTPLHHMSHANSTSPSYSPSSSSMPPSYCSTSNFSPPRLDPKLGGRNNNLIAFIRDRDIWVTTPGGSETQLTFCNEHDPDGTAALSCGVAEFVMQEEFHRFTGYYWAPSSSSSNNHRKDDVERILYIQLSESMVDLVLIPRPGPHGEVDEYRYPRTGTANAQCILQIVEFIPQHEDEEVVICGPIHKRLWGSFALKKLFPWMEYIVRFGCVWVQLLDRLQQRTAIVKIALCNFMSIEEYQKCTPEIEELYRGFIEVIFEERNHIWINVSNGNNHL